MLDRGQELDWFSSREILVEAVIAGTGFYLFIVHMVTSDRPFLSLGLFTDRNFSSGMVMVFCVSSVMLASGVLLAPYLQNLAGYPVDTAGWAMAPRGHRHDGVDVPRRAAGHDGGPAQDHGGRAAGAGRGAVPDEHLDAGHSASRR